MPAIMICLLADENFRSCKKRFRFYRCPVCKLLILERELSELRSTGNIVGKSPEYVEQIKHGIHGEVKNGRCLRLERWTELRCDMKYCVYCKRSLLEKQRKTMMEMSEAVRKQTANNKEDTSAMLHDILN